MAEDLKATGSAMAAAMHDPRSLRTIKPRWREEDLDASYRWWVDGAPS